MPLNIVFSIDENGRKSGELAEQIAYDQYAESCWLYGIEPLDQADWQAEQVDYDLYWKEQDDLLEVR